MTDEQRAKLSADIKARWRDPEYRAKITSKNQERAKNVEFQKLQSVKQKEV